MFRDDRTGPNTLSRFYSGTWWVLLLRGIALVALGILFIAPRAPSGHRRGRDHLDLPPAERPGEPGPRGVRRLRPGARRRRDLHRDRRPPEQAVSRCRALILEGVTMVVVVALAFVFPLAAGSRGPSVAPMLVRRSGIAERDRSNDCSRSARGVKVRDGNHRVSVAHFPADRPPCAAVAATQSARARALRCGSPGSSVCRGAPRRPARPRCVRTPR